MECDNQTADIMDPIVCAKIWEDMASECFRAACPAGRSIQEEMLFLAQVAHDNAIHHRKRQSARMSPIRDKDKAPLPPEIEKRFAHVEIS